MQSSNHTYLELVKHYSSLKKATEERHKKERAQLAERQKLERERLAATHQQEFEELADQKAEELKRAKEAKQAKLVIRKLEKRNYGVGYDEYEELFGENEKDIVEDDKDILNPAKKLKIIHAFLSRLAATEKEATALPLPPSSPHSSPSSSTQVHIVPNHPDQATTRDNEQTRTLSSSSNELVEDEQEKFEQFLRKEDADEGISSTYQAGNAYSLVATAPLATAEELSEKEDNVDDAHEANDAIDGDDDEEIRKILNTPIARTPEEEAEIAEYVTPKQPRVVIQYEEGQEKERENQKNWWNGW